LGQAAAPDHPRHQAHRLLSRRAKRARLRSDRRRCGGRTAGNESGRPTERKGRAPGTTSPPPRPSPAREARAAARPPRPPPPPHPRGGGRRPEPGGGPKKAPAANGGALLWPPPSIPRRTPFFEQARGISCDGVERRRPAECAGARAAHDLVERE